MPYINSERRKDIWNDRTLTDPITAGELNYYITKTVDKYIKFNGKYYQTFNEVIGVLECAKLELYRRVIALYEDQKKEENGDVYG